MKKVFMLMTVAFVLFAGYNMVFATEYTYKEHRVVVARGETLWDIAARYSKNDEDIRDVISRIRSANKLQSSIVYPGQLIVVSERVLPKDAVLAKK